MKIAILSDIHGNLPALNTVLRDISYNKCEHVFILGDLIGYYHWPKEVIQNIMALSNCTVIRGNHEDLLRKARLDPTFAIQCKKKYGSGLELCLKELTEEQMMWLDELPIFSYIELCGISFALYHGSDKETSEYIYPDTNKARIDDVAKNKADYIFFGHTHYPVIFNRGDSIIANPGSVGQPRDVGSLASYLIFNTKNRALMPRRLPFDHNAVRKKSLEHDPSYSYLVEILKRNNPNV